jgi:hypothetical protein
VERFKELEERQRVYVYVDLFVPQLMLAVGVCNVARTQPHKVGNSFNLFAMVQWYLGIGHLQNTPALDALNLQCKEEKEEYAAAELVCEAEDDDRFDEEEEMDVEPTPAPVSAPGTTESRTKELVKPVPGTSESRIKEPATSSSAPDLLDLNKLQPWRPHDGISEHLKPYLKDILALFSIPKGVQSGNQHSLCGENC